MGKLSNLFLVMGVLSCIVVVLMFFSILPLKIYVFFENRRSRHKVQNHTKYWQDVKAEGALFSTMNEAEWKAEWQMLREKQQLPSSYQMP